MHARKILTPVMLTVLAIAGLSIASNFVDNNTALPGAKTDRFPPTNPGQQWTASDANTVINALADLRTVAQRSALNVKAFGAKGDGITDDATAINAALTAAGATVSGAPGLIVEMPKGTYLIGSQLVLPPGVGLRGSGPASTIIKACSACRPGPLPFSATSMVKNQAQDGTQEFAFLESLQIDGNQAGGAAESEAVVSLGSLFVNSYVRDVVILNGSNVGLHVFASGTPGGMGPLYFPNVWLANNIGDNLLVEETGGNVGAANGIVFVNLVSEHQGTGKSAVHLKCSGHCAQWNFYGTHIEMGQGGGVTAQTGITIDGVPDVLFDGVQLLTGSVPAITAGIAITTAVQNVRIQMRGITNANLMPLLSDAKNSVTVGTVGSLPWYVTPEVIVRGGLRFTPDTTAGAKSVVFQNSSGTDRAWFDDTGVLTGSSATSAGLDVGANSADGSTGRVLAMINFARTRAFGFYYPDSSFIRFRAITAGIDAWDVDNSGTFRTWNNTSIGVNGGTLTVNSKVLTGGGGAPTLSSCGTSPSMVTGSTDFAGAINTGNSATTCTVTFASAFANAPFCTVTGSGVVAPTYSESTTALTMSVDVAATRYRYTCVGH